MDPELVVPGGYQANLTRVVHLPIAAAHTYLLCDARGTPSTPQGGLRVTHWEFAAATEAVRSARVFVANAPEAAGADVHTLELLVSELVTNAVLYARSTIVVDVKRIDEVLRVGVHDSNPDLPIRQEREPAAESGRGLNIVHNLALRWGVEVDGRSAGKTVWFEIPLSVSV